MQIDFIMSRSFIWCHKYSVGDANTAQFTIEFLTRNVELIKTLKRYQHRVCYSKLLKINIAFVIQK